MTDGSLTANGSGVSLTANGTTGAFGDASLFASGGAQVSLPASHKLRHEWPGGDTRRLRVLEATLTLDALTSINSAYYSPYYASFTIAR